MPGLPVSESEWNDSYCNSFAKIELSCTVPMSRATRLINRLDKVLARHDSFGDDPAAFVDRVFAEIEKQLELIKAKSKPEHWTEIYVERDRARVKEQVLNRVMESGTESIN